MSLNMNVSTHVHIDKIEKISAKLVIMHKVNYTYFTVVYFSYLFGNFVPSYCVLFDSKKEDWECGSFHMICGTRFANHKK